MSSQNTNRIFFIVITIYLLITITFVVALIIKFKKNNRPNLPVMVKDVDYFENAPLPVSIIEYMMDPSSTKKITTFLKDKEAIFCIKGKEAKTLRYFVDSDSNVLVHANNKDSETIFKMIAFVYNLKNYTFTDYEKSTLQCSIETSFPSSNVVSYNDIPIQNMNFFLPFARYKTNKYTQDKFLIVDYLLYNTNGKKVDTPVIQDNYNINRFYMMYFQFV